MTSPYPLGRAALAVVAVFALTHVASAQTTATWIGGNTTNDYNFGTNWSTGSAPNAIDSRAIFTNAANVVWTNSTNIIGSLLVSGGSVVLGEVPLTNDILKFETSSGSPIISNSSLIFMYANIEGNQGFTKTGSGELTFRYNTTAHAYTGNVILNQGTLTINQDSSLGNVNNGLQVSGNSTLNLRNGTDTGTISLAATRTISISNGVTLNLQTGVPAIAATVNGNITGPGRIDFIGISSGVSDATSTKFTFNGTNSSTGQTTLQIGSKLTLGSTGILSTNLSISGGSGTWAGVDLGGTTQNLTRFAPASASTTVRTIVLSNGTLNVTNAAEAFTFNGTNGTLLDMSNLATFTFQSGGTVRNWTIQPNTGGITNTSGVVTNIVTDNTNSVFFGRSSNQVTAITNRVGGAQGVSAGNNHMARLFLGTNNNFNSTLFEIGAFNGMGTVDFMADITNGGVKLRGTNGTAAMAQLIVGNTSSGTRRGSGVLNLGIADTLITDTLIGNMQANSTTNYTQTSSITMVGGTFTSTNLYVGVVTNPAIVGNVFTNVTVFQQNGGTSSITLVRMGDNRSTNTNNTIAFQSTYNLSSSNAVLRAATIDAGTNAIFGAGSSRKINFGAGRIETLDASTDLTISGFDTTSAGRIEIAVASNAQTKTFFADTNRKITLEQSAILTFDGGITKGGAGTLVLKGANVHNGNTTVAAGTLELQSTGSLRFQIGGSGTNNQLNGPGTASLNGQFVFNLASASTDTNSTWTIVSNSLTTTYGTNFLPTPGFSGSGGNWTNTTNGVNYVFAQSNGVLSVQATSGVTPYNAWVAYWQTNSAGFTNTAGTDNPDGDPFDNNEEFAFDGNPTIGTGALLTAVKVGTNAVFNYVALTNTNAVTYQVQITGNLTNGWTNASVTISNSLNQSNISQTNSYLR